MKILIFSDVHGNLPAFEYVLKDAGFCDMYVSLGDIVNYGPWSNECIDLALTLPNSVFLMGNHEEAFLKGVYHGKVELVNTFFKQTFSFFNRFEQIRTFLPSYKLFDYLCTHTIEGRYIFPDTPVKLDENYIIGHSHHQFKKEYQGFELYNSGSVGQNRKTINLSNYLLYYPEKKQVEMKSVRFEIEPVIQKMKELNYPQECIDYYLSKEIL